MLIIKERDLKTFLKTLKNGISLAIQAVGNLALLFLGLEVLGSVIPPIQFWVTKKIIDTVIASVSLPIDEAIRAFYPLLLLALALSTIQNLRLRFSFELLNRIWDKLSSFGQTSAMKQNLKLDLSYFETSKFYDQFEKAVRRVETCLPRVFLSSVQIIGALISFLSVSVLLVSFHWSLVFLVILMSLPMLLRGMGYSMHKYDLASSRVPEARKAAYLADLTSDKEAIKEIKLFGLGKYFLSRYFSFYDRVVRENAEAARKQFRGAFWTNSLENIVYYSYLTYVIFRVFQRVMTVGDISMFISAFNRARNELDGTLRHFDTLFDQSLYLNDYLKFMELKPKIIDLSKAKPLLRIETIKFKNVYFRYAPGESMVLRNISFKINPEEKIALVGENGAGKTTIVKLLCRFYDVEKGEILINGENIKNYKIEDLREQIGAIFQDFNRYHLTAKENIGFGEIEDIENLEKIKEAAKKAEIADVIEQLPKSYENYLGRRFEEGVDLSIGQWQRVALARAFFREASVLILDEPTASLDAEAEYKIFKKFLSLVKGKIALLISHRFSTVRLADRIIVVSKGEIREEGSHQELMVENGLYAKLFRLQADAYKVS